ncbi:MAG: transporter [Bacteroidota bacterium]
MRKIFFFLICIFLFFPVISQEMVTDRPDQTESSSTVPKKTLQWESGFSFESETLDDRGEIVYYRNLGLHHSLLRYGLLEKLELRLGADVMRKTIQSGNLRDSATTDIDLEPVSIGFKAQLADENGLIPELAVLTYVVFPAVSTLEGDNEPMPDITLAGSFNPVSYSSLGFNLGFRWSDFSFGQTNLFYSFVIGFAHGEKLNSFWELYGYRDYYYAIDDLRADAGLTYLVKPNFQLDLSGGFGITEIGPDYFISFGFSWRIPE